MASFTEIKEYERLTKNSAFRDTAGYRYVDSSVFDDLDAFFCEYTMEEADAVDCLRKYHKKGIGDVLSAQNFVGLIQTAKGNQIQILPKIDFLAEEDANRILTKRIFLRMLKSMKDFPSKVFQDASLNVDRLNVYELFIRMYLTETEALVKQGIESAYTSKQDNERFFKGKLCVNAHIKANHSHKERFYIAYDEFSPNRAENRLIKATLLKLQSITQFSENDKTIMRLLHFFEMVAPSIHYDADFAQIVSDRRTKKYATLLAWSKVFLYNKSFSSFSGDTQARALLFQMEKVFESYIAQLVKRVFSTHGWSVSVQDHAHALFKDEQQQRNLFQLRPDIVLTSNRKTIIMDTKWKRLSAQPQKHYQISEADLYQMYAYGRKYARQGQSTTVYLVYPLNHEVRKLPPILLNSYCATDHTVDVQVKVLFADLENEHAILDMFEDIAVQV